MAKRAPPGGTGSGPTSAARGRRRSLRAKPTNKGYPLSPPQHSTAPWRRSSPGAAPRAQPMSQRAGPRSLCNAEAPGGGPRAYLVHRAGRPSGLAPFIELPWGRGRALYERSGAAGGRAQRSRSALRRWAPAGHGRAGPWDAAASWWEGRASGLPRPWPGPVRDAPGPCRSLSCLPQAPPRPSFGDPPAGRPAGGHVASRQDGGVGPCGARGPRLSGRGPGAGHGGPCGLYAVAPGPGRALPRDRPGRERRREKARTPGPRDPLFGLPVGDLYSVRHVEVPPPDCRQHLDALGERLHDPATVLHVELVPLGRQVHRVRSRAL